MTTKIIMRSIYFVILFMINSVVFAQKTTEQLKKEIEQLKKELAAAKKQSSKPKTVSKEKVIVKNSNTKSNAKKLDDSNKKLAEPNATKSKQVKNTTKKLAKTETAQDDSKDTATGIEKKGKVLTGTASFYSAKFEGRQTANGEIFRHDKFTAACNVLPLGTWLKITNLSNNKTVIVKTNDRLHPKMNRLVDLTMAAAKKLDFVNKGLTKVKAEVIKHK